MRISDWSSDVCSSDLAPACEQYRQIEAARDMERMRDQLPLWELTREERDKRELADILASLGEAIEAKERETSARSEEHTSELQSLMRISYAVFCLTKNTHNNTECNDHRTSHNSTIDKHSNIQ